ncbi:hypothetical protein AAG906_030810 [Vitis piasezkii]
MARTRGAKSSSPSSRKRAAPKTPVQGSTAILNLCRLTTAYRFSDPRHDSETSARAQGLFPSAPEISYGAFADSQGFFLSPFRDPTIIHFTIDGRHGILGARHIAEALRIPYEPASPEEYRVWTNPSQSDIVRILSRGAFTRQYLMRRELPPSMFFIDALLRHNIFPLQHWVQRRGVSLEALFRYPRILLWPSSSDYGALRTLKRRYIRRSSEPMLFLFFSHCYVDSEHLGYPSSLNLSANTFAERYSLSKNGRT